MSVAPATNGGRNRAGSTVAWTAAAMVALFTTHAYAQAFPGAPPLSAYVTAHPWAAGVSRSQQALATSLYAAGNREFADSHLEQALARYLEAVEHWDHPAIRYNLAICFMKLDKIVEARDNLERSLRYGADALGASAYRQALVYLKLFEGRLAHVTLVARERATRVTLDSKLLFTGPGSIDLYLPPGKHQVVATRAEFLPASMTVVLSAGERTTYEIELGRPPTESLWPSWRPWAVFAGGAAAIGLGAVSYVAAERNFAAYDRAVVVHCPRGCDADALKDAPEILRTKNRARTEQLAGITLFSAGGLAVLAGAISLFMNESSTKAESNRTGPMVVPMRGGGLASMSWRF